MTNRIFIFDLDSTITSEEILPKISALVGKESEMKRLTESTMRGEIPFAESFKQRVDFLSNIPISKVQDIVESIKLNEELVKFIKENKERCFIVTGNLYSWIIKLLNKIGMADHCYCSHAKVDEDKLLDIESIIDKKKCVLNFDAETVVVGDGNNDAEMISVAQIGIGYGGVRPIAPAVLQVCKYAIYDEKTLVNLLTNLL